MNYVQHRCIVVTSANKSLLQEAYRTANNIFEGLLVSNIVYSAQGYESFFVAPDGNSREGKKGKQVEAQRAEFVNWLKQQQLDWVELYFSDEFGGANILNDCGAKQRKYQAAKAGMRPIE